MYVSLMCDSWLLSNQVLTSLSHYLLESNFPYTLYPLGGSDSCVLQNKNVQLVTLIFTPLTNFLLCR